MFIAVFLAIGLLICRSQSQICGPGLLSGLLGFDNGLFGPGLQLGPLAVPPCGQTTPPCGVPVPTPPCGIGPASIQVPPCGRQVSPCGIQTPPCGVQTPPCGIQIPGGITVPQCGIQAPPCGIQNPCGCGIQTPPCGVQAPPCGIQNPCGCGIQTPPCGVQAPPCGIQTPCGCGIQTPPCGVQIPGGISVPQCGVQTPPCGIQIPGGVAVPSCGIQAPACGISLPSFSLQAPIINTIAPTLIPNQPCSQCASFPSQNCAQCSFGPVIAPIVPPLCDYGQNTVITVVDNTLANSLANALQLLIVSNLLGSTLTCSNSPYSIEAPINPFGNVIEIVTPDYCPCSQVEPIYEIVTPYVEVPCSQVPEICSCNPVFPDVYDNYGVNPFAGYGCSENYLINSFPNNFGCSETIGFVSPYASGFGCSDSCGRVNSLANGFGCVDSVFSPVAAEVLFPAEIPAQLTCNFGYMTNNVPCVSVVSVEPLPFQL